jgi:peptide/nickel transport system permease protein
MVWRRFCRRRGGKIGLAVTVLIFLVAFLSPLLASQLPIVCQYKGQWYFPGIVEVIRKIPLMSSLIRPSRPFALPSFDVREAMQESTFVIRPLIPHGPLEISPETLQPASSRHWLGTDDLGRDVAARLIHATGPALRVGFGAMGVAAVVGLVLGVWAGYAGGWVDAVISRVIEIVMCFPVYFLILSVLVWVEHPGVGHVVLVIGLTGWTPIARYTRGEIIRLRDSDFAVASRALGASPWRVAFRHLLPHALTPAMVAISFGIANAILIEAGLSWLGFGVQSPQPSWGNMLRTAYDHLLVAPHLAYPPCVAIFVTVLVYNLIGDALRDALNPAAVAARK